jgi:hypothetical protein
VYRDLLTNRSNVSASTYYGTAQRLVFTKIPYFCINECIVKVTFLITSKSCGTLLHIAQFKIVVVDEQMNRADIFGRQRFPRGGASFRLNNSKSFPETRNDI